MARRINTFAARFDSECEHCGGQILQGDEIGYVDDEIACENCIIEATSEDVE